MVRSVEEQIQFVGPFTVSRFWALIAALTVFRDGFTASPELSGVVLLKVLLQLLPLAILALPNLSRRFEANIRPDFMLYLEGVLPQAGVPG